MKDIEPNILQKYMKYSGPKTGLILVFIIILQFGIFPQISAALRSGQDLNKYVDYSYFYIMSMYSIIVLGTIIFNLNGLRLLSDHFSLWIVVFSCFFRLSLGGNHALIYRLYLGFLGVILTIYIIGNRRNIELPRLRLILVAILWSVGTTILIALPQALLGTVHLTLPPNLLSIIVNSLLYNISFVTIIEEVCFRSLLVGFMIMNGYKENVALSFQSILFWIGHYMIISNPVSFFIAIPLLSLSTTLLMKKYKMVFLPIVTHTFVNVFTSIFVVVLRQYFL